MFVEKADDRLDFYARLPGQRQILESATSNMVSRRWNLVNSGFLHSLIENCRLHALRRAPAMARPPRPNTNAADSNEDLLALPCIDSGKFVAGTAYRSISLPLASYITVKALCVGSQGLGITLRCDELGEYICECLHLSNLATR